MSNWRIFYIHKHPAGLCLLLGALTLLAVLAGICIGAAAISPVEILRVITGQEAADSGAYRILVYSRLPRVAAGLLAGSALAVSGALLQSVLNNPLAAPGIIGVNAGAGLLVVLSCVLLPAASWAVPLTAFLGAALGAGLVLLFLR